MGRRRDCRHMTGQSIELTVASVPSVPSVPSEVPITFAQRSAILNTGKTI
jgi:hypothetical protein